MGLQVASSCQRILDINKNRRCVKEFGIKKEKICSKCKRKLDVKCFYKRQRKDRDLNKLYLDSKCKECCIFESAKSYKKQKIRAYFEKDQSK